MCSGERLGRRNLSEILYKPLGSMLKAYVQPTHPRLLLQFQSFFHLLPFFSVQQIFIHTSVTFINPPTTPTMEETLPGITEEILPATTEEDFTTEETLPATAEEEVTVTMDEKVTVPVQQNVTEKKWWKEPKDKIISWMTVKDKCLIDMRGNLSMVAISNHQLSKGCQSTRWCQTRSICFSRKFSG